MFFYSVVNNVTEEVYDLVNVKFYIDPNSSHIIAVLKTHTS